MHHLSVEAQGGGIPGEYEREGDTENGGREGGKRLSNEGERRRKVSDRGKMQ